MVPDLIPPFDEFFTQSPPVLPKLYGTSDSQEQRLKRICENQIAIANYINELVEAVNELNEEITS